MSFGTFLNRSLAATLTLASAGSALAVPTISDSTFANADWTAIEVVSINGGGSVSAAQTTSVGNPVPARDVHNIVAGGGSTVGGFHKCIAAGAVIDPAVDTLAALAFSLDRRYLNGFAGQASGPAIEQAGVVYRANLTGANSSFTTITGTYLPGEFVRVDGGAGSPDFGPTGSPISVGFYSQSTSSPGDGSIDGHVVYDNFSVTAKPFASSLVHEWNFEGNLKDSAGDALGTTGAEAAYRSKLMGESIPFELGGALRVGAAMSGSAAVAASVDRNSVVALGTRNFTIALWWQNAAGDTNDADPMIDCGDANGWRFQYLSNRRLRFTDAAAGASGVFESLVLPPASDWHHVVFVCDRNGTGMNTWYLDGQFLNSVSAAGMSNIIHDQDMLIGRFNENNEGMDGMIAKLQIYSAALTADEVAALAGYNGVCLGDANQDGSVNFADITQVLGAFGIQCP